MMSSVACWPDQETLDWLLEKENPSVRFFTLRDLLGRPETDAEMIEDKNRIMTEGPVPAILSKQNPDGSWGDPDRFYHDKYRGSVWQLLVLAELGADGHDPQIERACQFILEKSQDRDSFGFAVTESKTMGGGRHTEVVPCLTGNLAFSLIRLGQLDDARVRGAVDWICRYQRADDGVAESPTGWPYDRYEMCWGKHSCHMGVVKALKALAAIPPDQRWDAETQKIQALAEYLLCHHIHKKSHDLDQVSRPGWLKLGFPLMYQTDILEILSILTALGYRDSRMQESVEILRKKQTDQRWKLENTFNGRMLKDIEVKGEASKWITLKALGILRKFEDDPGPGTAKMPQDG